MTEPAWIQIEAVLAIHQRQIAEHGGVAGIRDEALLESALARPRQRWAYGEERDIPALAAAYAFGLIKNHPFADGNKRAGYVVCRTFLLLNGFDLHATPEDKYLLFLRLAAGESSEDELAEWIRKHLMRAGS